MRILAIAALVSALACDAGQATKAGGAELSPEELSKAPAGSYLILDVRTPFEYAAGHVDNAMNIPHDRLETSLARIQKYAAAPVVVYCKSGRRAEMAIETLSKAGFTDLHHLSGDFEAWSAAGYPVSKDGP